MNSWADSGHQVVYGVPGIPYPEFLGIPRDALSNCDFRSDLDYTLDEPFHWPLTPWPTR